MSDLKMPSPPRGHYWRIEQWGPPRPTTYDLFGADAKPQRERLVVSLVCHPPRTWWGYRPHPHVSSREWADWEAHEESNAYNATVLANVILRKPEHSPTHGLNGLAGYEWR